MLTFVIEKMFAPSCFSRKISVYLHPLWWKFIHILCRWLGVRDYFFLSLNQTYAVGTPKNRLNKTVLLNTPNNVRNEG